MSRLNPHCKNGTLQKTLKTAKTVNPEADVRKRRVLAGYVRPALRERRAKTVMTRVRRQLSFCSQPDPTSSVLNRRRSCSIRSALPVGFAMRRACFITYTVESALKNYLTLFLPLNSVIVPLAVNTIIIIFMAGVLLLYPSHALFCQVQ
ncbi:hypothetical protein EVAR_4705_1 [Eumeta japonica]|uniref:Uncharacterized protein n=1 Tax=Eumeta variegata TaxID=151549 RepID=A0A4C1WPH0_EUMVA|nr:hypothetical protein EVAR_4705_1 [Eumeta japonica]